MMQIQIKDDFDLDKIADSGQCFRWERQEDEAYHIIHQEHGLVIRPAGEKRYDLSCSEEEYQSIWKDYFDLDENYTAIRRRIREENDPFLYQACQYGRGIRILRQDPWETLISFIISQNRNIPAIRKSIALLCEAAGKGRVAVGGKEYYLFPSPEEILSLPEHALAACKLGYRCEYVKAAAADVAEGRINLEELKGTPEEAAIKALVGIHSVGSKVASCVSLFGLHHVDAFPVDVWIRRILEHEYTDGWLMEQRRPYNGIYQQYMFYCYRQAHGVTRGKAYH